LKIIISAKNRIIDPVQTLLYLFNLRVSIIFISSIVLTVLKVSLVEKYIVFPKGKPPVYL